MTDLKTTWNTLNHKDVLVRSAKTFVAAFVPVFGAGLVNLQSQFVDGGLNAGKSALIALTVAAVSAGITAVWNYAIQLATPHISVPSPIVKQ